MIKSEFHHPDDDKFGSSFSDGICIWNSENKVRQIQCPEPVGYQKFLSSFKKRNKAAGQPVNPVFSSLDLPKKCS